MALYSPTGGAPIAVSAAVAASGSANSLQDIPFANAVATVTYVSGIAVACSPGQTVLLTGFNGGGAGATASLPCTGTNTVAGATVTVTAGGSDYTGTPTSASASPGTAASASGTAVLTSTTSSPASVAISGPAEYWMALQGSNAGNTFQAISALYQGPASTSITGGTFGTFPSLTVPGTFTSAVGPVACIY